jgi:hypothetical protein
MTIDVNSSRDTLRKLGARAQDRDQYDYWEFIQVLPDFMDELHWAYVPLEGELGLAILVMSESWSGHLHRVLASLRSAGELALPLLKRGEYFTFQQEWVEFLTRREASP